jgi:hypothetical protein
MTSSVASAEASKNYILNQLDTSLDKLEVTLTNTVRDTAFAIGVNIMIIILLLLFLFLIILVYMRIISLGKAAIALLVGFILLFVLVSVFVIFVRIYTQRQIRLIGDIYTNFVGSEDTLRIINEAAGVYLANI